jgi:hypothetical protein
VSLVFRLFAAVLLVAALIPRGSTRHDRVLVVALDGVRLAKLRELVGAGRMPHVAAVLSSAEGGGLYGGSRRDPRGFWRSAFSGVAWTEVDDAVDYVWERAADAGLRAAVVALPETREVLSPATLVLPGADEVTGFIGDSAGRVVKLAAVRRGSLGWPYQAAAERVAGEIADLSPGDASEWIRLQLPEPDGRGGVFRVYRLERDSAYVTPVYRSAKPAGDYVRGMGARLVYVADDPSWSARSSRLRDYYRHARDLTAVRAELAAGLARGRWPLLVYFDPLPALVEPTASAGGRQRAALARDAYETIDARVGALMAAAGPRTAIVLLGREPQSRRSRRDDAKQTRRPSTGFLFVGDGASVSTGKVGEPEHLERVARTILQLIGVDSATGEPPIEAMAARFSRGRRAMGANESRPALDLGVPLTADSLRSLGLLSQSTLAPRAGTDDASAATTPD